MDSITILGTIFKYALVALGGVAVLTLFCVLGFQTYKRLFHGTKTLLKRQWFVLILILCWYLLVLGLTAFSRGANYTGNINFSMFSGYVNAWNKWSYTELQLIIFNMLMFAPLGFLFPLLYNKAERFSVICLISFLATLSIEVLQLITGRGIFEFDDLLHNFIGSIFGYFIIMFILDCLRNKKIKAKSALKMLALPFIYGVIILCAVIAYNNKDYGNLDFLPAEKQNMSVITIENSLKLDDEVKEVSVYKNEHAYDFTYGKNISEQLEELLGLKFRKTIRTEEYNKIFEADTSAKEQLTYFMDKGVFSYVSWEEYSKLNEDKAAENRMKIETWMKENDLFPQDAKYTLQNNEMLRWDVEYQDVESGKSDYTYGIIMAEFTEENHIANFDYQIVHNKFIRKEKIISLKDAYAEILKGNFEQYIPFEKGDKLYIENCQLDYIYDTKGYYRPVYVFKGYVNNKDMSWECKISALN